MDNAGIARRFEACEFDNYQAINQDAAKNLAPVSVMPAAGLNA
jgi:DNA replication protein DnaC